MKYLQFKPMRKSFTVIVIMAVFISQFLISDMVLAKRKSNSSPKDPLLSKDFNLHYTGKYCKECHEKIPRPGGDSYLKYKGDFIKLCGKCHNSAQGNYPHPVGMKPSEGKKGDIPKSFPLVDGKISCKTCHDLYLQCKESSNKKKMSSLRGAPFKKRTDFCYNCHNKKNYEMQDAHDQIDEKGKILANKCLYCHAKMPDAKKDEFKDIKLVKNIEAVCQGCHVIRGNHSGNFNHMIKPSDKYLSIMKNMEITFGIKMPLDDKGKMTCMTCHNPHEKGIIPPDRPAAKGADSKYRHRLPKIMCMECHKV